MLFNQAKDEFINYLKLIERSKETIIGYRKELNYFELFLTEKYNHLLCVDEIVLKDIEDYLIKQKEKGNSSATRNRTLYIIRSFYKYLLKNELVTKNIALYLEPVKMKQKERDYLTEKEFQQIVNAIKNPIVKTVVETMFYTGGRVSEILNLKLKDVDLNKQIIYIIDGKGGKDRNIPINKKLYGILLNYLDNIRESDSNNFFAFKKSGKVSPSYINKILTQTTDKIGLNKKVSAHTLRHSFGSNLLKKGASIVSIQKLLGHANLTVTTRYLHQDKNELVETVNLL